MKDFVVGSPYSSEVELEDGDDFLIIACDGVSFSHLNLKFVVNSLFRSCGTSWRTRVRSISSKSQRLPRMPPTSYSDTLWIISRTITSLSWSSCSVNREKSSKAWPQPLRFHREQQPPVRIVLNHPPLSYPSWPSFHTICITTAVPAFQQMYKFILRIHGCKIRLTTASFNACTARLVMLDGLLQIGDFALQQFVLSGKLFDLLLHLL